ncbi:unnamed protein product [Ectocarpus sp. 6 AP-2014]
MEPPAPAYQQQLLETAATEGDRDAVASLLDSDARMGDSLHHAIIAGNVDIVSDLILHGASLVKRDRLYDLTPLQLVARHGLAGSAVAIIDLLVQNGARLERGSRSPLFLAVLSGSFATVMALLRGGADAGSNSGDFGQTPVHAAAGSGDVRILVALLGSKPGGVSFTDNQYETPLHYACRQNHSGAVEVLADADANLEARDMFSRTPLVISLYEFAFATVTTLVQRGAHVNAEDRRGQTALGHMAYLAERQGAASMVDFLLRNGGDEAKCNDDGDTPLDMVCDILSLRVDAAGEVQKVHSLLQNAPADRRWRRIGLFVLLKSLYLQNSNVRVAVMQAAEEGVWSAATAWLLGSPKEIFREIVSYI